MKNELEVLRQKIDKTDSMLVKILAKRMNYIPAVARYKKKHNLPRYQKSREKEIIRKRRSQAIENRVNPDLVEEIMKVIIKYAHKIEEGYLGR